MSKFLKFNIFDRSIKYNPSLDVEFVFRDDNILFKKNKTWNISLEVEYVVINKIKIIDKNAHWPSFDFEIEVFNLNNSYSKIFNFETRKFFINNNFGILIKALNTYVKNKNSIDDLNSENFAQYSRPDLSELLESVKQLKFEDKSSTTWRPGKDDWERSWIEISNCGNAYLKQLIQNIFDLESHSDQNILVLENSNSNWNSENILFEILYKFHDHFSFDHYSTFLLTKTKSCENEN